MMVLILERVTPGLRGELTRWLIEPRTNVFVGHVNALVRERLWQKCCLALGANGGVVQIWSTNTEQRFAMRMQGDTQRKVIELEGLYLVCIPDLPEAAQKKVKKRLKKSIKSPDVGAGGGKS